MGVRPRCVARDWINAALVVRVTFGETDDAQPDTFEHAVDFDRVSHVYGARRVETAGRGEPRRDQDFVSAEERDTD